MITVNPVPMDHLKAGDVILDRNRLAEITHVEISYWGSVSLEIRYLDDSSSGPGFIWCNPHDTIKIYQTR